MGKRKKRRDPALAELRGTIKRNKAAEKERFGYMRKTHEYEMITIPLRALESACASGRVQPKDIIRVFLAQFGPGVRSKKALIDRLDMFPKLADLLQSEDPKTRKQRERLRRSRLERKRRSKEERIRNSREPEEARAPDCANSPFGRFSSP